MGDAFLMLHGDAVAELEALGKALVGRLAEPAPVATESPAVWPLVLAEVEGAPAWLRKRLAGDMRARDAAGREKYEVPLQVENGRRAEVDAYQEALDLCAYTRQKYERSGRAVWRSFHSKAVELAASIF